jgi:hypothetical protein
MFREKGSLAAGAKYLGFNTVQFLWENEKKKEKRARKKKSRKEHVSHRDKKWQ